VSGPARGGARRQASQGEKPCPAPRRYVPARTARSTAAPAASQDRPNDRNGVLPGRVVGFLQVPDQLLPGGDARRWPRTNRWIMGSPFRAHTRQQQGAKSRLPWSFSGKIVPKREWVEHPGAERRAESLCLAALLGRYSSATRRSPLGR